jgi:hypothetical protein
MSKRGFLLAALLLSFAAGPARGADRNPKYIELDAMIVQGQIQRPQAVYIIQRANLDFGADAKRKSFVSKIQETIEGDPF